jgi:hypothetical protein
MLAKRVHFFGCAGETMDEQAANPPAWKVERLAAGSDCR